MKMNWSGLNYFRISELDSNYQIRGKYNKDRRFNKIGSNYTSTYNFSSMEMFLNFNYALVIKMVKGESQTVAVQNSIERTPLDPASHP